LTRARSFRNSDRQTIASLLRPHPLPPTALLAQPRTSVTALQRRARPCRDRARRSRKCVQAAQESTVCQTRFRERLLLKRRTRAVTKQRVSHAWFSSRNERVDRRIT